MSQHASAQSPTMFIEGTTVTFSGDTGTGANFNFPFSYGSWSPSQTLFSDKGTIIQASFKLVSQQNNRSELKNSSIKIFVNYSVQHAGVTRSKTTEHIYYFDAERKFTSTETFSFKPTKYDVRIVKLQFTAYLKEE